MRPERQFADAAVRDLVSIAAVWFLVQLALFAKLGLRHGGDTGRYLRAAQELLDGGFPQGKAASYLGYDIYVAAFLGSGLGEAAMVAGQCLLALLAALCLYDIAGANHGRRAALIAALLMASWPDLQRWNFYILTDSLFVSLGVIAAWCVLDPRQLGWTRWLALPAVTGAALVRPNGVILLLAAGGCWVRRTWARRRYGALIGMGVVAALALPALYWAMNHLFAQQQIMDTYAKGEIIWGYEALRLPIPAGQQEIARSQGLEGLASFVLGQPLLSFRLFAAKVFQLYFHARPYYSALHNFIVVMTLIPLYVFAVRGAWLPGKLDGARTWFGGVTAGQTLVIGLTFADWDGRDLLVVYPALFLFAAAGLASLMASGKRLAWPKTVHPSTQDAER